MAVVTDEALYAVNEESHGMWSEQGMDAPWMHLSFPEFQQAIRGVVMFVALDAETGELLGMHSFRTRRKQGWCYGYRLAVASSAQREGIASRMLAYEAECIRQAGYAAHTHQPLFASRYRLHPASSRLCPS